MKRPNVNILYICVIFALITLFSCKGKGGTYRDGVFYPMMRNWQVVRKLRNRMDMNI